MFLPDWVLAATKNLIRISCFLASALTAGVNCTPNTAAFRAFNGFLSQEIMLFTKVSKCNQTRIFLHCMSARTGVIRNVYCCASRLSRQTGSVGHAQTETTCCRLFNHAIIPQTQVTNKITSINCIIDKHKQKTKQNKHNSEKKYL